MARESHSQPIGGHLYGWVDSHPHFAYRWFHHPYLFGGRVETAPEAVSVLSEDLYEMKDAGGSIGEIAGELGGLQERLCCYWDVKRPQYGKALTGSIQDMIEDRGYHWKNM